MLHPKSHRALWLSLLGLVALLAACGSQSTPSPTGGGGTYDYNYTYQTPTKTGGKVIFGDWQAPDSTNQFSNILDPTVVNSNVFSAMWDGCVIQLPNLKLGTNGFKPDQCTVTPTIANGGESADGTKTTFHIDPRAKWSDGQPIVAADWMLFYNMYVDPNIGGQSGAPPFNTVTVSAPDDHTVTINWGKPYAPYLLNLLGFEPSHKYPTVYNAQTGKYNSAAAQKLVNDAGFLNNPPVNGPYMPQSFGTGGSTVVMVPNPNFFSNYFHKPALDKLIFQQAGSKDALIQAFKAGGNYDQVEDFTPADLPKFAGLPAAEVVQSPAFEFEHFEFNQRSVAPNAKLNGGTSIMADKRVRKALIESFNHCNVLTGILGVACDDPVYHTGEVTSSIDPAFDPTVQVAPYNPQDGATLLTQAGYKLDANGLRTYHDGKTEINLQFVTTSGNLVRNSTLALAAQQWGANLGIQVTPVESTKIFAPYDSGGLLYTGNFDCALFAFSTSGDGDSLTTSISTSQIPGPTNKTGQNESGVNDPAYETALDKGRQELDPAKRMQIYHDLYAQLAADDQFYPLYTRPDISLALPTVGNYKQHPTQLGNMWNIGEWFQKA